MTIENDSYTEPTTSYWQDLTPEIPTRFQAAPPYRFGYPVRLPCGRILVLPLRRLPDGHRAVASLIANQASNIVVAALADHMSTQARALDAEIIVGLPTLGLAFAALVAERLGQSRYVPLGYSRKFWYDDALSEPVSSITSPEAGKRLRLDPNLLPLIEGRRVAVVDDAISSGATAVAAVRLLRKAGADIAGMIVAMKQTNRWEAEVASLSAPLAVRAVYGCPLFQRNDAGWMPLTETQPSIP
jgi:adenine/guanine phosphoribosyltransferase-like PRPP-binding protein